MMNQEKSIQVNEDEFQVYLLPGRCPPGFREVAFHNEVYGFWKSFWARVFQENNTASIPDANIFYRQETVVVITHKSAIVGTVFCTENNVASDVTRDIAYFSRPYIKEYCEALKLEGRHRVATCEMLSVNFAYRKKLTGVSFGLVLLGLVTEAFKAFNAEIMMGPVRIDNGARELLMEFGWKQASEEYLMHGTPVALAAVPREDVKECGDDWSRKFISKLWAEKIDLRLPEAKPQKLKLVA